jgi:hypothetical protein
MEESFSDGGEKKCGCEHYDGGKSINWFGWLYWAGQLWVQQP